MHTHRTALRRPGAAPAVLTTADALVLVPAAETSSGAAPPTARR
ncbi:hypothetical protein [Kitasatospora sp. NPDC001527]